MDTTQKMWDNQYSELATDAPKIDNWLDKYSDILNASHDTQIVDLGCGFGNDTLYLTQKGLPVLSCDYSEEALKRLSNFIDNPNTLHLDMRNPLPFDDNSIKVIICDLTLHYFDDATTKDIAHELYRVLTKGGTLLCRVNSTDELDNEKKPAIRIDNNYYKVGKKLKRYFDENDVKHYFKDFYISNMNSYIMHRYIDPKHVLEFCANKK